MISFHDAVARSHVWVSANTNRLVTLAAVAVGVAGYVGYATGDSLYANGIPPWDSALHAALARDFYGTIKDIGPYNVQRILPGAVVYHVFRLFHVVPTDSHIIFGFITLNAFLVALIGYVFCLIADELGISAGGKWLGFVALFFNFAMLKHRLYDPMLTDTSAFAAGTLLLYFYLVRNSVGIGVTTFLGAFVWPTVLLQGAFLLAFPRTTAADAEPPGEPRYARGIAVAIASFAALTVLWYIVHLQHIGMSTVLGPYRPAIALSTVIACAYLFFGVKTLLTTSRLFDLGWIRWYLVRWRVIVAVGTALVLIAGVKLLQSALASKQGPDYTPLLYLQTTLWVSILYPAISFVAHVVYFGPTVILLAFWWPDVCRQIHRYGVGLSLCAMFCFVLSLNSETRQMLNFLPIFAVSLAKVTDALSFGRIERWAFAVAALLVSKVWLTIGALVPAPDIVGTLLMNQLLFMNNGPAMSGTMYVAQGSAVLVLSWLAYYFYVRTRRTRGAAGAGTPLA